MAKKKKSPGDDPILPYVAEFKARLQKLADSHPGERLLVDLARDAGMEAIRRLSAELIHARKHLRRAERKRRKLNDRHAELLHDLAVGPILLPVPADRETVNPPSLLASFRHFRDETFPKIAGKLHVIADKAGAEVYQHALVMEVLLKGCSILAEHTVHRIREGGGSGGDEAFLSGLRGHIAGNLNHRLASEAGLQVTPEIGKHLDVLIADVLAFLVELQATSPAARLLVPKTGEGFDPSRHNRVSGRESHSERKVREVAFPGLYLPGAPPIILERAVVHTLRVQAAAEAAEKG